MVRTLFAAVFLFLSPSSPIEAARILTVTVYNVENLFDVDGVSLFPDYDAETYGPKQLARKLQNTSAVLQRFNNGAGPDIVMLCELEADQTPASTVTDVEAFLKRWSRKKARSLLNAKSLDDELAGAPAWAWLIKQLRDDRLPAYNVAVATWRPDPTGQTVAHNNVILSRFPILEQRTHDTDGARGILEVQVDVDGRRLYLFDNHWKSGASDPSTEPVRIGNARVLRNRLDEILKADPHADIIVGGDFNSQYNQKQRNPRMPRTAINDVLGSQGDELALQRRGGADLYNLWFELPNGARASDVYRDEWGTLMQIMITRGLYDFAGVQYVDNTFTVGAFPDLNAHPTTRRPVRWTFAGGGAGYSDHFPVSAVFRTVDYRDSNTWLQLVRPSPEAEGPADAVPALMPLDDADDLARWPRHREFRRAENVGKFFKVAGSVTSTRPFAITVEGSTGGSLMLWVEDPPLRREFFESHEVGARITVVGELGQYKGEWQLVVPSQALRDGSP